MISINNIHSRILGIVLQIDCYKIRALISWITQNYSEILQCIFFNSNLKLHIIIHQLFDPRVCIQQKQTLLFLMAKRIIHWPLDLQSLMQSLFSQHSYPLILFQHIDGHETAPKEGTERRRRSNFGQWLMHVGDHLVR